MNTELIGVRKPTQAERDKGAEIVFIREDENGNEHIIYGCKCYESWEQWGETKEILGHNVDAIERWRHGRKIL